jgi:hypothetical protein
MVTQNSIHSLGMTLIKENTSKYKSKAKMNTYQTRLISLETIDYITSTILLGWLIIKQDKEKHKIVKK